MTERRDAQVERCMSTLTERAPVARGRGLTPERRVSALRAYAESGVYARVAEALGVHEDTLHRWRNADPDFQAALDEAGRQHDLRIGQLARKALEVDLTAYLAGEPLREQVMNAKGDVATLDKPRLLNVGMVRTALTKLDPSWTHPVQHVAHTHTVASQAWDDGPVLESQAVPALPEPEA